LNRFVVHCVKIRLIIIPAWLDEVKLYEQEVLSKR